MVSFLAATAPLLAQAEADPTKAAVEQISRAVLEGAANRVQDFRSSSDPKLPARKGIEFYDGDLTIRNIPRLEGNRFVEVRIPAATMNHNREFPHLVIVAERKEGTQGVPEIHVQIPVGRVGDWPLNAYITKTGTQWKLGRTPLSRSEAADLLAESGFTPRANLPAEAKLVIGALGKVQGLEPLDKAKEFLGRTPRTAGPARQGQPVRARTGR
jgi:hypothetical protein